MGPMSVLTNVRWWILAAAIIGLTFGDIGGQNDGMLLTVFLMLMMCFSLTKLDFSKGDIRGYSRKILICIILGSFASTAITLLIGLLYTPDIWAGWVILACVPCAISVVSGTYIMKGDLKIITLGITAVYLIAIAITPLFSLLLIGDSIDPMQILKYVLLFIAIPFLISRPLKRMHIPSDINTVIINISFFVFAMIGFGRSKELFFNESSLAVLVIFGTFVRIAVIHFILEYSLRHFGVKKTERIPYVLMLIWKNSGLALTLTMLLFPGQSSILAPAIVSMVFEQIYFMFMIWYYEKRVPSDTVDTAPISE